MSETAPQATPSRSDYIAGAAFGALLGVMTGLSATPVVSTIIAALVALLAGVLGASEKVPISPAGLRRLTGFAIAAAIVTPGAIWVRTHDLLGPSLAEQRAELQRLGYADNTAEQRELLTRLRLGVSGPTAPSPSPLETAKTETAKTETAKTETAKTETAKTETAAPPSRPAVAVKPEIPKTAAVADPSRRGVLYADLPPDQCDLVWQARGRAALLAVVDASPAASAAMKARLRNLPSDWSADQLEMVKSIVCPGG